MVAACPTNRARLAALCALLSCASCFDPPNYEGRPCTDSACPSGFFCSEDETCRRVDSAAGGDEVTTDPNDPEEKEPAPRIEVAPAEIDFGLVAPDAAAALTSVTVRNLGDAPLLIGEVRLVPGGSPEITLNGGLKARDILAPGTMSVLGVTLTPAPGDGTYTAALEIRSNDPIEPLVRRAVSGRRTVPLEVDPGCDETYPVRLWPVAANVATCANPPRSATGPGAVDWFSYAGCPTQVDFDVTPATPIRIASRGDGCTCAGCTLWHIRYVIQEDLGAGFVGRLMVEQPDIQCPNGNESQDVTVYAPNSPRVRLLALPTTSGRTGFYYTLCSAR